MNPASGKALGRLPASLIFRLPRDPAARAHLGDWLRSLRSGADPLREPVPILTYAALEWLERRLGPESRVFEWGSGASTLYFAERVRELVSVEHDPAWHARVAAALEERGLTGCRLQLAEPEPAKPETPRERISRRRRWLGLSFERYVTAIDAHPEGHFDLVCVDGRQRNACGLRAVAHVRPGGHLLLDDAERPDYRPLHDALARYPVQHFHGLGPFQAKPWLTSVWQINPGR